MHQSSYEKMEYFRDRYLEDRREQFQRIFDLGSLDVNGSYRPLFDRPPWQYTGLDISAGRNVDIVLGNPYHWPQIRTDSVDVLISGQAFEHIEFFWITMLEVARVLKPSGLCCIVAPSGGPEHRYPVDCWRFYPDGFAALARFARLRVLEVSTQWEPDARYDNRSNTWRDTLLVCRKYRLSGFFALRQRLWRSLLHRVLLYRLPAA
jgi:SAM-dependent methyltransferase